MSRLMPRMWRYTHRLRSCLRGLPRHTTEPALVERPEVVSVDLGAVADQAIEVVSGRVARMKVLLLDLSPSIQED